VPLTPEVQKTTARTVFLRFLAAVAALHVCAIALYHGLDVARMANRQQRYFAWAWMVVTVAVVFAGLQRIKRARRGR